jgi:hypothetical protein
LFVCLAALAAACSESTSPQSVLSPLSQQHVLAAVDASGYAGDDYGASEPVQSFQMANGVTGVFLTEPAPASGTVMLPAFWGVRHGRPTKTRTVTTSNDTAVVNTMVSYNGTFMMIVPMNGAPPDTVTKPALVTMTQTAVLVKDTTHHEDAEHFEDADGTHRDSAEAAHDSAEAKDSADDREHWRLIQITPQNWQMTDPSKRTIQITRVRVLVNGTTKIDATDPAHLYDVGNKLPRLMRGDVVQVLVDLSNTAGTGNTPPSFVFLHVRHGFGFGFGWHRMPMQQVTETSFQLSWVVREGGWRDRFAIEALDSQTFQTDSGTEFRGNAWGVPYRIQP